MRRTFLLVLAALSSLAACGPDRATLPRFAALVVQVRTPDGIPVPGVRVEVVAEGDSVSGSFVTGDGGDLSLIGIDPGAYEVGVRHPPTGYRVPATQQNPVRAVVEGEQDARVRFLLVRE